jgi:hypothetical protein
MMILIIYYLTLIIRLINMLTLRRNYERLRVDDCIFVVPLLGIPSL